MKTQRMLMVILVTGVMMIMGVAGCTEKENPEMDALVTEASGENAALDYTFEEDLVRQLDCLDSLTPGSLSNAEMEALTLMREEELLARDVYLTLAGLYSRPIFANIAKSEQQHTDMVALLLARYGLPDPGMDHQTGVFLNEVLQDLYDQLVTSGSVSLLDGMIVGATIEDLDILDLEELLHEVDNADIICVFSNLMKGSRNHLRSFYKNIEFLGGSYSPQFISPELFQSIISTPHEVGPVSCCP